MRYLLTIQYLGTRYAGWQSQTNATAIQDVVEGALAKMLPQPVRIEGASRTDSGVHAAGQRAHVDVSVDIAPLGLVLGINDSLPGDIRVVAAESVAEDFHCRYRAVTKTYVYRIWNDIVADVFHSPTHVQVRQALDESLMANAAVALEGSHDFRAFTVASPEVSSTVRTVQAASVRREGNVILFSITANGYLRYMVRRIAGSLIEIGRGVLPVSAIAQSLEPGFAEARWTAPPEGLMLQSVAYDL